MSELDFLIFGYLFKDAFEKCFGHDIKDPLTETESKIFCNRVLEQTGLSIGWKSVKNYSIFITDAPAGKKENPSVATLDTLARYVLSAPYTNEIQRKNEESHHPYWFLYRERFNKSSKKDRSKRWPKGLLAGLIGILIIILLLGYFKLVVSPKSNRFTDNFKHTDESAMLNNGWFVKAKDPAYWNKRGETPGMLTLFTLRGDNWPDPSSKPGIKNLLLRAVPSDCFTAEVHLEDFIPKEEWQQAGILLMEDTTFTGKSIRLSLAYNDYFGGIKRPREILIQAITSLGDGFGKPEEIAHKAVFYPDSLRINLLLAKNLQNSALRIEKHGSKFRFLYSSGVTENEAFKEVVTQEFEMKPKYIGLFAIKGFTNSAIIPVRFKFFRLTGEKCE
jgi:hypothetical protein